MRELGFKQLCNVSFQLVVRVSLKDNSTAKAFSMVFSSADFARTIKRNAVKMGDS